MEGGGHGFAEGFPYPAQPSPPPAKVAMAQVEGGDYGTGAVSFAVRNPATVRCRKEWGLEAADRRVHVASA